MYCLHGIQNLFAIVQFPVQAFQFLVLTVFQVSTFDFFDLKFQKSTFSVSLLFIHVQTFQLTKTVSVLSVSLSDFLFQRIDLGFAIGIQNLQLLILIKKRLVFVLAMNIQKAGCRCFHLGYSTGLSIDLADASAIQDLAGEKYLTIFQLDSQIKKSFFCTFVFYLKEKLHKCIGGSGTYHISGTSAAKYQLHGAKKDGFTCSSFTCEDIQPRSKFHLNVFDKCQIFYMKMN